MSLLSRKGWYSSAQVKPNYQNMLKKAPFGYISRPSRTPWKFAKCSIAFSKSLGSMGRYSAKRCYLGTHIHLATVSISSSLRTRLFFKGEGMLGSNPNHVLYNVIRIRSHYKYIFLVGSWMSASMNPSRSFSSRTSMTLYFHARQLSTPSSFSSSSVSIVIFPGEFKNDIPKLKADKLTLTREDKSLQQNSFL